MPPTNSKADVYEQITNAIIAVMEAGSGKFEMPWHTLGSPMNTPRGNPQPTSGVLLHSFRNAPHDRNKTALLDTLTAAGLSGVLWICRRRSDRRHHSVCGRERGSKS